MKSLYLICGPMGVGKTTTGLALRDKLPDCAFLDGQHKHGQQGKQP